MQNPALEMLMALLRVGQQHAFVAARRPAAHHRVIDVHMELQRKRRAVHAERLDRERVAFRQKLGALRQIEAFAMPLIDVIRPLLAKLAASGGRTDRIVADLGMAFYTGTKFPGWQGSLLVGTLLSMAFFLSTGPLLWIASTLSIVAAASATLTIGT